MEKTFEKLPPVIFELIFSFLSLREICNLEETCKTSRELLKEKNVWKKLLCSYFNIEEPSSSKKGNIKDWKAELIKEYTKRTNNNLLNRMTVKGSAGVGKSSLIMRFVTSRYDDDYNDPTLEDDYHKIIEMEGGYIYKWSIQDTTDGDYGDIFPSRDPRLYGFIKHADAFLLVFSLTCRSSFDNAVYYYDSLVEIQGKETVPMVLVGNKCDLVDEREVTREEAEQLAKKLNAPYIETSAKDDINVTEAFHMVAKRLVECREELEKEATSTKIKTKNKECSIF